MVESAGATGSNPSNNNASVAGPFEPDAAAASQL